MRHRWLQALFALAACGCASLPSAVRRPPEVWWIDFPAATIAKSQAVRPADSRWLSLDTVTFRPVWLPSAEVGAARNPALPSPVRGTVPEGQTLSIVALSARSTARPEVFRAVTENAEMLATTAALVAAQLDTARTESAILDIEGLSPEDLPALIGLIRAVSDSLRSRRVGTIAVSIPAADTLAYPARPIARVADLIVVELEEQHRQGTPAGPVVTVERARRHLGIRASDVGPGRLVVGIPAYGYLWPRASAARRVTYDEAATLAAASGASLVRDPSSLSLHARSDRDGWEIWIPDHEVIGRIVDEARRIGIYRFAIYGALGADPAITGLFRERVRR